MTVMLAASTRAGSLVVVVGGSVVVVDASVVVVDVVAALVATVAGAGERVHVVRPGESVSSIAKANYGSFEQVELLLRYNGKSDPQIKPGERLKVPVSEIHEVRPGDTWSELAERYLAEPSAYPVIALLNGMSSDAPLNVGTSMGAPGGNRETRLSVPNNGTRAT